MKPSQPQAVAEVFESYPVEIRREMMVLRQLILKTAASTPGVGKIEETLKWGEPAYVTSETKSGSTIRIDWKQKTPELYFMYFICTTNLVDTFRTMFPNDFKFEGNRALVFQVGSPVSLDSLVVCIAAALTYRQSKQTRHADRAARTPEQPGR